MSRRIFDLILSEPWYIQEAALEQILAIANRVNDHPELVEARLGRPLENSRSVTMRGHTAVIPVTGPIFRYANLFTQISGATSTEILARDFTQAIEDPRVQSIVLDVDSPGGQGTGISELARMVRNSPKPVTTYFGGVGASAAYWIGAAAHRVVAADTSMLGSIGTVITYRPEKDGPIRVISQQSPLKQATPDTPGGLQELQKVANDLTEVFIQAISEYRGVSPEQVLNGFGQGGVLVGSKAVSAGMADSLGSFESVIAGLSGEPSAEVFSMSNSDKSRPESASPHLEVTAGWVKENHPEVYQEIFNNGVGSVDILANRMDSATAERSRIQGVFGQALPGHDALIREMAFDGKTTPEQAAVRILNAERQAQQQSRQAIDDLYPAPAPVSRTDTGTKDSPKEDPTAPLEERAKASWDTTPALRNEFGSFETYLAYRSAEEDGKVRRLTGGNS